MNSRALTSMIFVVLQRSTIL
ncbi:hypothetical protein LINGRAHAP2_LOCUS23213 [Linum grandiflorum]